MWGSFCYSQRYLRHLLSILSWLHKQIDWTKNTYAQVQYNFRTGVYMRPGVNDTRDTRKRVYA